MTVPQASEEDARRIDAPEARPHNGDRETDRRYRGPDAVLQGE